MANKIVTDSSITIEPEVVKDLDTQLFRSHGYVVYSDSDLVGEFLRLMKESKNLPNRASLRGSL